MKLPEKAKKFVFKRSEPDLPRELPLLEGASSLFAASEVSVADHRVEDVAAEGRSAGSLRAESSVFEAVNLSGSIFNSVLFKDVRFVRCDFANVEARRLNLVRVEFVDCRMTGLRAVESVWDDVLVSRGDQRYAQFRVSRFRSAEFEDCNFREADFEGSDLSGSIFRRCNMESAEMSKTKLIDVDLRGSRIEGLQLDPPAVRGALVDASQAMILVSLLGLRVG